MARTVLTYGTFDLFHVGHLRLLQRARALGDRLVVAVSTDEFNAVKGKRCIIPYEQRAEIVANIKGVDRVIPEHTWAQKVEDIRAHHVDVFVMGDDWRGKFDELKPHCEVVYLDRTQDISTTDLKQRLKQVISVGSDQVKQMIEILQQLKADLD